MGFTDDVISSDEVIIHYGDFEIFDKRYGSCKFKKSENKREKIVIFD